MYKKTTSHDFQRFGSIITSLDSIPINFKKTYIDTYYTGINLLYYSNDDVYIKTEDETAILCVSKTIDSKVEFFSIHKIVKLPKNTYFNIIVRNDNDIDIYTYNELNIHKLDNYVSLKLIQSTFTISEVYAYFYNIKQKGYKFNDTKNNYYEFVFVDNGSLEITVDNRTFQVNEYDAIVIGKGQVYNQRVNNKTTSFLSILFQMSIDNIDPLLNRKFKVSRALLSNINKFIKLSEEEFPYKDDLLVSYLKIIIVELLSFEHRNTTKPTLPVYQNIENDLLVKVINYIEDNIYEPLCLDTICKYFCISRSTLQNLFKDNLDIAPKQYINNIKLKKSKLLIKESKYTITEISSMLGFNSVHYFSRKFSHYYNIAPTDYAKSIYERTL